MAIFSMHTLQAMTSNWRMKLFALGVAVVLFLFVTVENATPVDVDFRIEYRNADDIMIVNDAPSILHTTLKGPWATFRSFDINNLEPVTVDLTKTEPGSLRYVININAIRPPGGMRVVSVHPAELDLVLDRRVEKQIAVHPDIPDTPAFGYEVLDVRLVPPKVRVIGPASKIQSIDFINTRSIDIIGREEDLSLEVDLRPPPPPLRLLDKRVVVYVEIGEEFVQRSFQNMPVIVDNAPRGTKAFPESITFVLKGPRRVIGKLDKDDLTVHVDIAGDLNNMVDGSIEKNIQIHPELPDRVQLVAPVPKVDVQLPLNKKRKK